ncbi:S-receptor-like serine/threonine-protein kinase protein [Dioscorea alata]|uniref:S-receptor-like serine/threonine-protein kinase protein n=1 Tax=Dioscorea alata TaxID=55571 RepID=A0ACB7UBX0_DIOAL|nr:S-receptor-like serine/threonine-protein kinase protein [Dioscorea alata]
MACSTLLAFILLVSIFHVSEAEFVDKTTILFSKNGSTSWKNNNDFIPSVKFIDGTKVRLILLYGPGVLKVGSILGHGCGFVCSPSWNGLCQFAVVLLESSDSKLVNTRTLPQIIWSANRDNLVEENATLEFINGSLILKNSNGDGVWSSKTSSLNVVGMKVADYGPNLVLFNKQNKSVWETFNHPTDTLLSSQFLRKGQSLTSSPKFMNSSTGLFSLSINHNLLTAYVHAEAPIPYLVLGDFSNQSAPEDSLSFVTLQNGHLVLGFKISKEVYCAALDETKWLPASDFMRLDSDGSLRIYSWQWLKGWMVVYDFMEGRDPCQLPLRCGNYGVCRKGQCSCPKSLDEGAYFSPKDDQSPQLGCSQVGIFADGFKLVDFGSLSYFAYSDPESAVHGIQKLDDCKEACLRNSSCEAVFFLYSDSDAFNGLCYLPSIVLSIQAEPVEDPKGASFAVAPAPASTSSLAVLSPRTSASYLKVRVALSGSPAPSSTAVPPPLPTLPSSARKSKKINVFVFFAAVVPAVSVFAVIFVVLLWRRRRRRRHNNDDEFIEQVPGMPVRFSYKELCIATAEFSQKIGRGGFGTVFRGVLNDGTLVAVKRLERDGQGMDEFLAEVKTIGSIHHINLVQLIGFCAEKSHRLLVYEFMTNGSLDTWIFGKRKQEIDWITKVKIITDIAKGLAYLHEECRQRIAHLDVKPHNVLLDDKFNAKVSDFGLAKVIDRDRSQITATVRGTLGYLAPEWQHSEHITVKADIYSFGIVLLEILCCRKNLDYSQNDSRIRLLSLLKRKADENQLISIVHWPKREFYCDEEEEEEEALKLIRLGLWCLNDDYKKRPSMSTVVKFLEGAVELDDQMSFSLSQTMVPSILY